MNSEQLWPGLRTPLRMDFRISGRAAMAVLIPLTAFAQQPSLKPLLIRGATVIDCAGHPPRSEMSVLVSNGRIAAIGPVSKVKTPANAEVLDARGKYLIPGLWNMHVHLGAYENGKRALAVFLAEGVTGVRDMGSPLDDVFRLRHDTENGTILGPHMVVAGPIVQGPLPFQMPVFIATKDGIEARSTVQMLKSRGADFIKVQDAIPHDIYIAVADEAHLDHIQFAGHIPPTVLPEEASDLGQQSIEHLGGRFWGVLIGSSARKSDLHAQEVQMYHDILAALEHEKPPPTTNMRASFTKAIIESYDLKKASALDANPLADIHNTSRIAAVVFHGHVIPPRQSSEMQPALIEASGEKACSVSRPKSRLSSIAPARVIVDK